MLLDKALGIKLGFNTLYSLAVFLPGIAVSVRRLHDIGKSGWLLLIFYIVIFVILQLPKKQAVVAQQSKTTVLNSRAQTQVRIPLGTKILIA